MPQQCPTFASTSTECLGDGPTRPIGLLSSRSLKLRFVLSRSHRLFCRKSPWAQSQTKPGALRSSLPGACPGAARCRPLVTQPGGACVRGDRSPRPTSGALSSRAGQQCHVTPAARHRVLGLTHRFHAVANSSWLGVAKPTPRSFKPPCGWLALHPRTPYPDVRGERNEQFSLIEVLWSVGRSVMVKRKLLDELMATLARAGLDTENVMVCFKETLWENWSFAGGRLIHT